METSRSIEEFATLATHLITHKCSGSFVAFSISKSVEPNEELKVGLICSQVLLLVQLSFSCAEKLV